MQHQISKLSRKSRKIILGDLSGKVDEGGIKLYADIFEKYSLGHCMKKEKGYPIFVKLIILLLWATYIGKKEQTNNLDLTR